MNTPLGTFLRGTDDPWRTFGIEDLCTWHDPAEPGICVIQARRPDFARKLAKRSDTDLFRKGRAGDYLRIFRAKMEPWKARQLVNRYLKAANEGFSELAAPAKPYTTIDRVTSAVRLIDESTGRLARQTLTPNSHRLLPRSIPKLVLWMEADLRHNRMNPDAFLACPVGDVREAHPLVSYSFLKPNGPLLSQVPGVRITPRA